MKIEINSRFSGKVLFCHDCENNTLKLTVEAAARAGAYLVGARLDGASLVGASLDGASLAGAYLVGARLDDKSKLKGGRPVLQIGPIGSRSSYFVAYLTESGVRLRAGCWFGTLAQFEEKLKVTHADNEHGLEYRAALVLIQKHAEIWENKKD